MTMGKKQRTTTTAFGSPGRRSHNAAPFYNGRIYQDQPQEHATEYMENSLPPGGLDKIYLGSAEQMAELPDSSIHLMLTSPPYNVGKDYDADLSLDEYLAFLNRVWKEVARVLVPGGRACINVANLGRKPYIPLHALIAESMLSLGFLMRGEIIWNKAASASSSTAWGSWRSASNPTLRDVHEYILVFSKGAFKRQNPHHRKSTISRDEFLEFTKSIWSFSAETASRVGHPAPFPIELPYRLIQLYSYEAETVLDPFMGSGQTALAAIKSGRYYVGYEINAEYVSLANVRIQEAMASGKFRFEQSK